MNGSPIELVDSHAHLDMKEFDRDRDEVVSRAFAAGVRTILCPADITDPRSMETTLALVEKYPTFMAAAGMHPHQANLFKYEHGSMLRELAAGKKIRALGEIGLDFHYHFSSPEEQKRAFRFQLDQARELNLPVIIHSRDAGPDVIAAVEEIRLPRGGVLHCFTETWEVAGRMIELGFLVSFSGILTFPKAQTLREAAKKIPLDRLLVETDSPYLAPVPYRGSGKRNEPAFIIETAKALAELKSLTLEELAEATGRNFRSLFV
jgi:TatD DNase family protein